MADQVKAIFNPAPAREPTKDKLLQTKLREKEEKEAHRSELTAAKDASAAKRRDDQHQLKEERAYHDTKRSARDRRVEAKREAHAETGQECEHGIWRCSVCFPHQTEKEKAKA